MDVVSSIAAVSQLTSQTIHIIQQISEARKTVHGLPKLVSDHFKQLLSLQDTLRLVDDEVQLQTASVTGQVSNVHEIAQELHVFLQQAAQLNTRSSLKQYVHALSSSKQSEEHLSGILNRLDRAGSGLQTRILLALVSITRTQSGQLVANLSTIQRIDTNVQEILGSRLSIAEHLLPSDDVDRFQPTGQKPSLLPLRDTDIQALGLDSSSPSQNMVSYIGNMTWDQAQMVNGNIGRVEWNMAVKVEYRNNEARGQSLQVNGQMDIQSFSKMLEARK